MNDTLKAAGRIGAELGAAKAENDRLRGLVRRYVDLFADVRLAGQAKQLDAEARAALSQQPEPSDTFTAVDMATAAAQGFRDGQAAVEPTPAQDEAELSAEEILMLFERNGFHIEAGASYSAKGQIAQLLNAAGELLRRNDTRPAQTEQQPIAWADPSDLHRLENGSLNCINVYREKKPCVYEPVFLRAAPIAQTAPQGKFRMGELVKKSTGSEWEGRVVGWYSTEQTKEGYAVESEAHAGSVQIYPAKALEAVDD